MSRSYRKQPVWKDHQKGMKKFANRKVRRALNQDFDLHLPHRSYRKYFCSYDICDYCSFVDRDFDKWYQDTVTNWAHNRNSFWFYKDEPFPDRKEEYRKWMKWYRGK